MADPFKTWDLAKSRPRVATVDGEAVPLVLHPARLPDAAAIPPRPWLYGTQLVRGFVTVLVAPGGTGKSVYAMCVAAALASGKNLLGDHVFGTGCPIAVLNLEDPMDELERRLAAIMIRHKIDRADLEGRYFMHSGESRRVHMASLDPDGFTVVHPDEGALIAEIQAHGIGLIVVDPFAESHSLEENSNPQMVQAAAAWRRVARATNCAIMLVHHVRKGIVADIDSARGAKALTDSARIGLLLSPMAPEDAEQMGIGEEDRQSYVRLDNAKANLAPKGSKAKWFELSQVNLGNATPDYPNGDNVASMVAWDPPNVWRTSTDEAINRVLDVIARAPEDLLYLASRRGGLGDPRRWAGHPVMDILDCNEAQAAGVVAEWLRTGLLKQENFRDAAQRKTKTGVVVDPSKRPGR